MIPNIFHFICISPMKFELYHYLAVKSALLVHKPTTIFIYVDKEPDGVYWELIRPFVIVETIVVTDTYFGVPVTYPQYKADIIRLEKLIERGGIYMDIDNLSIKSFTELFENNTLIMGGSLDKMPDVTEVTDEYIPMLDAISNAIIMCEPNHPFLKKWYEELPNNLIGKSWAYHAVCLPREILRNNKFSGIKILHWNKYFCPIHMFDNDPFIFHSYGNSRINEITSCYTLVFYQTMVYDKYLKNITPESLFNTDCIFSRLFKKYLQASDVEEAYKKKYWVTLLDSKYDMIARVMLGIKGVSIEKVYELILEEDKEISEGAINYLVDVKLNQRVIN